MREKLTNYTCRRLYYETQGPGFNSRHLHHFRFNLSKRSVFSKLREASVSNGRGFFVSFYV